MQKFYHRWLCCYHLLVFLASLSETSNSTFKSIINLQGNFSQATVNLPQAKKQVLPPVIKNEILKNWDVQLIFHDPYQHHHAIDDITKPSAPPPKRSYPKASYKNTIKKKIHHKRTDVYACLPRVEQICQDVMRSVKVIKNVQRCYEVPSVECLEPLNPIQTSLCGNSYQMDQQLTKALVARVKKQTECMELKSRNYRANFCYYLPFIESKQVGATLLYPKLMEDCQDVLVENPGQNCQLKMVTKCTFEPTLVDEMQHFLQCRIEQKRQDCQHVPSIENLLHYSNT